MADFTSSSYLCMRHASDELPGWAALTTGRPSVLGRPAAAAAAAGRLAALQGAKRAVLARSSLHGLSDCIEVLTGQGSALAVDSAVYPVGRWAVQRAAGAGTPVTSVRHQNMADLTRVLACLRRRGLRPVVVVNGMCSGCSQPYPIADAVRRVRAPAASCSSTIRRRSASSGTGPAERTRSAGVGAGRCLGLASRLTASCR